MCVNTIKIKVFPRNYWGKRWVVLFFHPYHINHSIGNRVPRNWMGHPQFAPKIAIKNTKQQKFIWSTKANMKWVFFSMYITKIIPMQNWKHEILMCYRIFSQKLRVKTTKNQNCTWSHKGAAQKLRSQKCRNEVYIFLRVSWDTFFKWLELNTKNSWLNF